ncbi:MAG TPA: phage baseplate assembly protein V [Polyangia bacterium]|nr:phage baseplate assembly protein V [Polyangia bacterium]
MKDKKRYYGKYRGTVLQNIDTQKIGRLLVQVPDVLGPGISSWAMPCLPMAGMQAGMFVIPPMQSGVWVEFEQGDPDYPIWVGAFWGNAGEVPAMAQAVAPAVGVIALQTQLQNTLILSDMPGIGGFQLMTTSKAMIQVNDTGIIISNGKGASIVMTGNTVAINGVALVVS